MAPKEHWNMLIMALWPVTSCLSIQRQPRDPKKATHCLDEFAKVSTAWIKAPYRKMQILSATLGRYLPVCS
jgi:hypothetical protein